MQTTKLSGAPHPPRVTIVTCEATTVPHTLTPTCGSPWLVLPTPSERVSS